MVVALIFICALVLKRFNLVQQNSQGIKLVTSLRLGAKERLVVVQVGEQQLLLGVTNQNITLLETLSEPVQTSSFANNKVPNNILSFLASKKV